VPGLGFCLFLLLAVSIAFWPVLYGGRVLSPADRIYDFAFFRASAPPGHTGGANPALSDPLLKFVPWRATIRDTLRQGRLPLWNPYIYAGTPLLANAESAVLYPIHLLGLLLSDNVAPTATAVFHVVLAGLGMYLYSRTLGCGEVGATVSGLAFALGGSMTVWQSYPVGHAYAWMPLLFLLGEGLVRHRRVSHALMLALLIAIQVFAGHYQTLIIILMALGACMAFGALRAREPEVRWRLAGGPLALAAGGVVLGLTIAAVQLLPFGEWLQHGMEVQLRLQDRSVALAGADLLESLASLATMALPNLYGNPTWGVPHGFVPSSYIEHMTYMGIAPLALALFAVLSVARRKRAWIVAAKGDAPFRGTVLMLAALGLVALGLALPLPGLHLLHHLPGLCLLATNRYRLIFTFCVAVLAGVGADILLRLPPDAPGVRRLARELYGYAGLALAGLVALYAAIVVLRDLLVRYNRLEAVYPVMVRAFAPLNPGMYLPVAVALLLALAVTLYSRGRISRGTLTMVLPTLVVIDLLALGIGFNPSLPAGQILPITSASSALANRLAAHGPARILALRDDLPPNLGMMYGLHDAAGVDFAPQRYAELALAAGGTMPEHFRIRFPVADSPLIDLLNVRYLIAADAEGLPPDGLHIVYRNAHVTIYENEDALPRAYGVYRARVAAGREEILSLLTSGLDLRREIVIEEEMPMVAGTAGAHGGTDAPPPAVEIVRYEAQRVEIAVDMAADGLLYLGDAYYPGWYATVDGHDTPIYRANYAFRAVPVPAGRYRVMFTYRPISFRLGLRISLVALCATLVGLAVALCRETRRVERW
jgi:hypothetical protein